MAMLPGDAKTQKYFPFGSAIGGELLLRTRLPAPGLRRLEREGVTIPGPLLAVCSWQAEGVDPRPAPAAGRCENWVQDSRVVAVYDEGPANPVRFELRWQPVGGRPGLELELSAGTSLVPGLCGFEVFTCSRVPEGEILVPVRDDGDEVKWVDVGGWCAERGKTWAMVCRDPGVREMLRDGRWPVAARTAQVGEFPFPAVLYRPQGATWSYAELGRSMEATRIVVRCRATRARWGIGLFGQHLEKGVIWRTSLCSLILDRDNDLVEIEKAAADWQERLPSLRA